MKVADSIIFAPKYAQGCSIFLQCRGSGNGRSRPSSTSLDGALGVGHDHWLVAIDRAAVRSCPL